ncbi:unnamed protein product, partial [Prorocentrum cordatum]
SYSAGISACEKGKQWERALALLSEMREAKLEPNVISYSAGISTCEKGEQWQRALALLSEMREAKLEGNVISYSAGISACEKARQWQLALALLREMREAKLEPNVISYSAGISACEKALGSARARQMGSSSGSCCYSARYGRRSQDIVVISSVALDQRVREVGGEIGAQRHSQRHAVISARGKTGQKPELSSMLKKIGESKFNTATIDRNGGIRACEKHRQRLETLSLAPEMLWEVMTNMEIIRHVGGRSACEKGGDQLLPVSARARRVDSGQRRCRCSGRWGK